MRLPTKACRSVGFSVEFGGSAFVPVGEVSPSYPLRNHQWGEEAITRAIFE